MYIKQKILYFYMFPVRFGGHIQSRMGGVEPRVGIFMANNMEYAPLLLGTISVGAVATTLNHTYTAGKDNKI